MSALSTSTATAQATSESPPARLGLASLALGIVAAGLTMTLSLVSLVLGAIALVLGGLGFARRERPVPAAVGMTAAAVSITLILMEVFALGN